MSKIIDNMDVEMKALAKAFVKAALEKGYNIIEIDRIVREFKEELVPKFSIETPEEQEFRAKAIKFAELNKELGNIKTVTEMICVMYKLFNLPDKSIRQSEIVEMTYERLYDDAKKISN